MTVCSGQSTIAAVLTTYAVSVVRDREDQSRAEARIFNWSIKLFVNARVVITVNVHCKTREMAVKEVLYLHPSMQAPWKAMLEALVGMRADEGEDVDMTARFVK